jgi:hypothetical protein
MRDAIALEAFLARIYVDAEARERFLEDPIGEASRFGLSRETCTELGSIDREGLELAAGSFARKRAKGSQRNLSGSSPARRNQR